MNDYEESESLEVAEHTFGMSYTPAVKSQPLPDNDFTKNLINSLVDICREDNECFVNVKNEKEIDKKVLEVMDLVKPIALDKLKKADIIDLMDLSAKAINCDTMTDPEILSSINKLITDINMSFMRLNENAANALSVLITKQVVTEIFEKDISSRIGFNGLTKEQILELGEAFDKTIGTYAFTNISDMVGQLVMEADKFSSTSGKELFDINKEKGFMDF